MKILLIGDITYKSGLTYEQACEAMSVANKHPFAKYISFFIHGGGNNSEWDFCGRYIPVESMNYDELMIEINDADITTIPVTLAEVTIKSPFRIGDSGD